MLTPNAVTDVFDFKSLVDKYPGFYSLGIYGTTCAVIGYFLGELSAGAEGGDARKRAFSSIGAVFGLFIGLWLAYTVPLSQLYNVGGGILFLVVSAFFGIWSWKSLKEGILEGHKVASAACALGLGILTYFTLMATSGLAVGETNILASALTALLMGILIAGILFGITRAGKKKTEEEKEIEEKEEIKKIDVSLAKKYLQDVKNNTNNYIRILETKLRGLLASEFKDLASSYLSTLVDIEKDFNKAIEALNARILVSLSKEERDSIIKEVWTLNSQVNDEDLKKISDFIESITREKVPKPSIAEKAKKEVSDVDVLPEEVHWGERRKRRKAKKGKEEVYYMNEKDIFTEEQIKTEIIPANVEFNEFNNILDSIISICKNVARK